MRIGIDVDDVLAECAAPYVRAFAKEFGLELADGPLGWHTLDRYEHIPRERRDDFRQTLYGGRFFADLDCYPDARDAIARLSASGHEVHFITARSERRRAITEEWLRRQRLLELGTSVQLRPLGEYVPRSYDAVLSADYKVDVARRLALDAFCEDDPIIAARLAAGGIRVFLFDRPWNREVSDPAVRRVRDWDEVVRELVPA